ncbi:hypothetical protein KCU73_g13748, partial [Aureobasidium melanogenum]
MDQQDLTSTEGKKRDQDDLTKEAHDEPATGVGSFMERQYNLADREAMPAAKKQKIDDDN